MTGGSAVLAGEETIAQRDCNGEDLTPFSNQSPWGSLCSRSQQGRWVLEAYCSRRRFGQTFPGSLLCEILTTALHRWAVWDPVQACTSKHHRSRVGRQEGMALASLNNVCMWGAFILFLSAGPQPWAKEWMSKCCLTSTSLLPPGTSLSFRNSLPLTWRKGRSEVRGRAWNKSLMPIRVERRD